MNRIEEHHAERLTRLEVINEQLEKRLISFETGQRDLQAGIRDVQTGMRQMLFWLIGLQFTSWLTIMGAILWKLGG